MFRFALFAPLCFVVACSGPPSFGTIDNDGGTRDVRVSVDSAGRDSQGDSQIDRQLDSQSLAEVLPASCSGICDAIKPTYPTIGDISLGDITTYSSSASEGGACNYGKTGVRYFAASNVNVAPGDNRGQWQGGLFCGQCVEIAALTSQGVRTVVVRIMDRCADEWCGMDLGGDATAAIMGKQLGRYQGAWRLVSCDGHPEVSDGLPSLFVNSGSNPDWSIVQIRNPNWPVAGMAWQDSADPSQHGDFEYANTLSENYWVVPHSVLKANATFDLTIRFTDGSTSVLHLTSAQLATPSAQYGLK